MRHLLVYASLLLTGLSGCISTASFYSPPTVNVPLLYRQGQATVDGTLGIGFAENSQSSLADLSAAYSPIANIAVIGNYHWFNSSYGVGSPVLDKQNNNARMGEIGIGGYLASEDPKVKLVADAYAGAGFGRINSDGIMNGSMNMTRIFLQPGVGMRTNIIDLALTVRLSGMNYNYSSSPIGFAPNGLNSYEKPPTNGSFNIFVEPSFTMRLGYKFIKLHTQLTWCRGNADWNYDGFAMNFGLHFSLEYLQHGFYNKPEHKVQDAQGGM